MNTLSKLQVASAFLARLWALPKPIVLATLLAVLSGLLWALFSLGAFANLGMPFFEGVALPMQIGVIFMGIFLLIRLSANRPESLLRTVPTAVKVIVPLAVLLGVFQLRQMPDLFPVQSPAGNPVRNFDAAVENGTCTAIYNGSERIAESLGFCAKYQTRFNSGFAGGWLLFSAIELWMAWAIYGGRPVGRVPADGTLLKEIPRHSNGATAVSSIRPTKPYLWLSVRIAILAYWAFGGWRGFGKPDAVPAFVPIATLVFAALSTRFGIVQTYTSVTRSEPWLCPSWFLNPFQRSQPFQFFHLAGLGFVLLGVFGLMHALMEGQGITFEHWPIELFGGAFGMGILIGIYWAMWSYRSHFQRVQRL